MAAKSKLNHVAHRASVARQWRRARPRLHQPAGRGATICAKTGGNSNDAAPFNGSHRSLEAPSGFLQWRPRRRPDRLGRSSTTFAGLNAQTSDRWISDGIAGRPLRPSAGPSPPTHVTQLALPLPLAGGIPNQPLTRDSLRSQSRSVSSRRGHGATAQTGHPSIAPCRRAPVIRSSLGVGAWEITASSFTQPDRCQFDGGAATADLEPGRDHLPSTDPVAGDKAKTRVFDANGERTDLQTGATDHRSSAEQGQKNNWAHDLAARINAEQSQIRAGQQGSDGHSSTRSTARIPST